MLRIGSLCSGYGGLTLAVQAALGGEVAWHSEYEAAPSKVLDVRFPGVPNLGDMTAIDWSQVEPVTVLEGGTPCQDVSHAGAQRGMVEGSRSGLWSAMREAVAVLRPELVIWENVRGVASARADSAVEPCPGCVGNGTGDVLRALGRVLGDLADLGYDAEWVGLPASAVGAPHERFRFFVAAHPRGVRRLEGWRPGSSEAAGGWPLGEPAGRSARSVADTEDDRRSPLKPCGPAPEPAGATGDRPATADADRLGLDGFGRFHSRENDADGCGNANTAWGAYEPAIRRWERILGRPAPAPRQLNSRGTGEQLAPRFSEWMMGLPEGWVTDVPGITRKEQLTMLGNGVVVQQAAAAIRHMLERLS